MKECDIFGGQNVLWPLVHIFRGSGPRPQIPPRIYAPANVSYTSVLQLKLLSTIQYIAAYKCSKQNITVHYSLQRQDWCEFCRISAAVKATVMQAYTKPYCINHRGAVFIICTGSAMVLDHTQTIFQTSRKALDRFLEYMGVNATIEAVKPIWTAADA